MFLMMARKWAENNYLTNLTALRIMELFQIYLFISAIPLAHQTLLPLLQPLLISLHHHTIHDCIRPYSMMFSDSRSS
jgi:hypothetical protein